MRTAALSLLFTLPAAAHHGRDFLLVQDASVPVPFSGILYSNFEFAGRDGADEWSFEPGIQYGLGGGFSAGLTATFLDEGAGMDFAALSPQFQWIIPGTQKSPLRFSVIAGYQFGQASEEAEHGHAEDALCGPELGPDAPACEEEEEHTHEHSHSHQGIHQHGADAFFARLVAETDLTANTKLALNLISVIPDGGSAQWGYAAGLRHSFSHDFAAGLEVLGDFRDGGYHEAALAAYFSPSHTLTFKFGAGVGLTEESPDFTLHAGVLYRF